MLNSYTQRIITLCQGFHNFQRIEDKILKVGCFLHVVDFRINKLTLERFLRSFRMNRRIAIQLLSLACVMILLIGFIPARAMSGQGSPFRHVSAQPLPQVHLQVDSGEKEGLLFAEISGHVDFPFAELREALARPAAWCEFIPLVFNVKSCTYQTRSDRTELSIYIGRKFFENPRDAIRLDYLFHVSLQTDGRLDVFLSAKDGPFGTSDYRIALQVRAAKDGRAHVHLHSSFRPSLRSTIATRIYLATSGRDKIGFSLAGHEGEEPVYVKGVEGIVERNAMRYYLALKAFIDTLHIPEDQRFAQRLKTWYRLTEKYPEQLHEMEREEYLDAKHQERRYQRELQENLG